jgi:hypothetical protein
VRDISDGSVVVFDEPAYAEIVWQRDNSVSIRVNGVEHRVQMPAGTRVMIDDRRGLADGEYNISITEVK